jgi:hypothetical protein
MIEMLAPPKPSLFFGGERGGFVKIIAETNDDNDLLLYCS